jgi:hypothetical protein
MAIWAGHTETSSLREIDSFYAGEILSVSKVGKATA